MRPTRPITVKNFIELAEGKREWTHPTTRAKSRDKLYDGTIFHRVIPDFMIQGGDPAGTGMGGPGYRFQDETKGSPHKFDKPGKLAMANSGPNTNGCQFFITVAPTAWLTGNHTIFGEVVEGQEIVKKISLVPRNSLRTSPTSPWCWSRSSSSASASITREFPIDRLLRWCLRWSLVLSSKR